jgi:tetratricopeptide (TPR) repeat protein
VIFKLYIVSSNLRSIVCQSMVRRDLISLVVLSVLFCCGCGKTGMSSSDIATAQQSFDAGQAALESSDFESAEKALTQAIVTGGLDPDQIGQAMVGRARARLQLGRLDDAEADLREAEQGATNLGELYAVWGDLMIGRNDLAQSREMYAKARQHDPKVVMPEQLRR